MKNGRHLIRLILCLFVLLVASGAAQAGNDLAAASASLPPAGSASCGSDNKTPLLLQQSNHNRCDFGGQAGLCAPATTEPGGSCHYAGAGLLALQDLEGTKLDDESLGRVSGGAAFFATPDVIGRSLFAIILWDEGKPRRSSTNSTPYEWGNYQLSSTNSAQGR